MRSVADSFRCPKCGGKLRYLQEIEGSNSNRVSRYIVRCPYCGFRNVLQELRIAKEGRNLKIVIVK